MQPRTLNNEILIVDGFNLFLRSFAMVNALHPTTGDHIGALIGSIKSLGYMTKITNPTKIYVVFDGVGGSSNKRNINPLYKANRSASRAKNYTVFQDREDEDESIKTQMSRFIEYLSFLPVYTICIDGMEADDIIAYLAKQYEQNQDTNQITIASADRDFLQLCSDKIQIYSPTKKKFYKPEDVKNEYGVLASNFIWSKVILGDDGDNLKGVSGIGPKKLLKLYPELIDTQINNIDEIFDKASNNVNENKLYLQTLIQREQLKNNYQLMNLHNVVISDENIKIIDSTQRNEYNPVYFETMYRVDGLGDAIKNVKGYLREIFGSLIFYN